MLKISKGEFLSIRGAHAAVEISSSTHEDSTMNYMGEEDCDLKYLERWRGREPVFDGMIISLRELEGEGLLEFVVVDLKTDNKNIKEIIARPPKNGLLLDAPEKHDNAATCAPYPVNIWLCPLGRDLFRRRIEILSQQARDRGLQLTADHRKATHWVVSEHVSLEQVASHLRCSEEELRGHLDKHEIKCMIPTWFTAAKTDEDLMAPSMLDFWLGYRPKVRKRNRLEPKHYPSKRKRISTDTSSERPNAKISQVFRTLSKLYQASPIFPEDEWKAYNFHKIAGRLQYLAFDIQADTPKTDLRNIHGLGRSTISMVFEYLQAGTISRIQRLQNDPLRIAMKKIMSIWGVGRATALHLLQRGYYCIEDVRRGIKTGELHLDRNQLVGVECYEDILEDMARDEVEQIGNLVIKTFQALSDSLAEATIVGSYRRGKSKSGDVDVLILMKDIPGNALQKLVDLLFSQRHIAYHLIHLPGMQTGVLLRNEVCSSSSEGGAFPIVRSRAGKSSQRSKKVSSYMGVFYSPKIPGKRRRVDIKIYPYSQKPFASLYFTGSAHFNRSMRLWAKTRHNLQLNDKGLFDIASRKKVMKDASTEEDVFQLLNLRYKAPVDRTYFDDVIPLSQNT